MIHEEMVVTGKVHNMHQLGPFIYRLCNGKDTYRLSRRVTHRRKSGSDFEEGSWLRFQLQILKCRANPEKDRTVAVLDELETRLPIWLCTNFLLLVAF